MCLINQALWIISPLLKVMCPENFKGNVVYEIYMNCPKRKLILKCLTKVKMVQSLNLWVTKKQYPSQKINRNYNKIKYLYKIWYLCIFEM